MQSAEKILEINFEILIRDERWLKFVTKMEENIPKALNKFQTSCYVPVSDDWPEINELAKHYLTLNGFKAIFDGVKGMEIDWSGR